MSSLTVEGRDELQQLAEASVTITLRARLQQEDAVEPLLDGFVLAAVLAATIGKGGKHGWVGGVGVCRVWGGRRRGG